MSDSSALPKSCPKCGAALPSEATDGLCPNCLMNEALQPTQVSDASKPKHSAILAPETLAPFFPQYEILRMLGRGGMGAVYLARQISLNRLVAIKILPADLGESDMGFAERFKNEAQAMAQLSHAGIVAVYDFGQTTNGLLYIVMEYIEGTDVQLMLASQGRLHSAHAMAITAHVCDALQYAHSCGIIHRDIKPSNIMVGNNGVVKVADFGLAKMSQGQTTGLTQSGMAMGTPHFMAPEALTLGSAVDQRADIYAVGVMLYQMLTGKLPQGMFEMPSFQVPGLDPRYDRIVAKALREDRSVRYQAAAELRYDLDAILTQPVEKVAPEAEEVKALPPVEQRGKKKARVPSLPPPQAASTAPAGKKPVGLILTVLGVAAALVAAFVYFRDHGVDVHGQASGPTNTQPVMATMEQPFVNSLGMKFVPVPITGGPTDGKRVLFSVWETRVQDYEAFVKETRREWLNAPFEQGQTHPAVNLSWTDAQSFCAWLTERERKAGKIGSDVSYRLPSDHEWSCAAGVQQMEDLRLSPKENQGRVGPVYAWGKAWPPPAGAGNFSGKETAGHEVNVAQKSITSYHDDFPLTAPVGSFAPDRHGLFDLAGNVWEFCEDWFTPEAEFHVSRGGSFLDYLPQFASLGPRAINRPDGLASDRGFRVVLAPVTPSAKISSLSSATAESPFTNTLGMKFVPVPITGGPTSGKRVLFSVWETRVQDYETFTKETKHEWPKPDFEQAPTHPAVNMSWDDAQAFCHWLTERERKAGRLGANETYRLPSDHEWSCAVGIGDREDANNAPGEKSGKLAHVFPWGDVWPPPQLIGNISGEEASGHESWNPQLILKGYRDAFPKTSPAGSFQANQFGLCDLAGNAWEWVSDLIKAGDPARTVRGGSFVVGYNVYLRSSVRERREPSRGVVDVGFRCVLSSEAGASKKIDAGSAAATKDQPFVNSLGMKFVPVSITGGPTDGKRVLFSVWETRVQDYEVFASETKREWPKPDFEQDPRHPAVMVSWDDAQAFCAWLTERERKTEKLGANERYRLPSDHEWSCAAGIGSQEAPLMSPAEKERKPINVFPWGMEWPPATGAGNYAGEELKTSLSAGNYPYIAGTLESWRDGYAETSPVGSFGSNSFGLSDLSGNAWEWCQEWFDSSQRERVLRGASWTNRERPRMLSSHRNRWSPDTRISMNGFRCVLAVGSVEAGGKKNNNFDTSHTISTTKIEGATKDAPFINTLGMKFVPVPITGGPTSGPRVLFSIWETRVQDYEVFVRETTHDWPSPPYQQEALFPAGNASLEDARAFCAWLTERERKSGWLDSTEAYRLPSDHEWSCAVGIGQKEDASQPASQKHLRISDVYPWGTGYPPPPGAGNYNGEEAVKRTFSTSFKPIPGYDDGYPAVAPVGSCHANPFGLFDLGGNLWEICEDRTEGRLRVTGRGACFLNSPARELLASWRSEFTHSAKEWGFRIVLAPAPPSQPAAATKDNPFTNSLGMKFVPLPGTKSLMSIHETRNADYAAFTTAVPAAGSGWKRAAGADSHPAVKVSWEEAAAFCAWLGKKENRRYRLPTDREWSIAVGMAGQESATLTPQKLTGLLPGVYPWGTQWPLPARAGNYAGSADGFATTAPVMSFAPNALGFYDLGGNVWEFCADGFNETAQTRVLRGASWSDAEQAALLSSCRDPIDPSARSGFVGFRCVLDDSKP